MHPRLGPATTNAIAEIIVVVIEIVEIIPNINQVKGNHDEEQYEQFTKDAIGEYARRGQ